MVKFYGYKNNHMEDSMTDKIVISLYDYTGEALKPWAEAGYQCFAHDIQHTEERTEKFDGGGSINYKYADLHNIATLDHIYDSLHQAQITFAMAFPVCTDMAVSGARHFKSKAEANPSFQDEAVSYAVWCARLFNSLHVPFFVENPVSVLATKWRKPDHSFHPYEYGEYLTDAEAVHPRWPDYIAERDAYTKKTCLWTGNGFRMPTKIPTCKPTGYSTQHLKLGGKSQRTKDIRSATPRGFSKAVYEFNSQPVEEMV